MRIAGVQEILAHAAGVRRRVAPVCAGDGRAHDGREPEDDDQAGRRPVRIRLFTERCPLRVLRVKIRRQRPGGAVHLDPAAGRRQPEARRAPEPGPGDQPAQVILPGNSSARKNAPRRAPGAIPPRVRPALA